MLSGVNFEKWKAKQIRLAKQIDNISDEQILEIYVKNCADKSVFMSYDEMLYKFYEKYCDEISPFITTTYICPNCGEPINVTFLKEDLHTSSSEDKQIKFNFDDKEYVFVIDDPVDEEGLNIALKTSIDKIFTEFCYSIKTVFVNGEILDNYSDIDQFMEQLPISTYNFIMDSFNSIKFKFNSHKDHTCPFCNTVADVSLRDIPELIKAELC